MRAGLTFEYPLKIEFEDLDVGRVVHHPKYLNFYERARCASLVEMGAPFSEMLKEDFAFAVAECEMKLEDALSISGLCHWMKIQLVYVNLKNFRATRIPEKWRTLDDSNVRPSDS